MSLITPASGVYNFMILLLPILTLIRVNETHKQKMLSIPIGRPHAAVYATNE